MARKALPYYVKAYDPWCAVFFVDPVVVLLVPIFTALHIHPNVVTALSLACTIVAGVLFACGCWLWAAGLFWGTFFFDALDGKLARFRQITSEFGGKLDCCLDRLRKPVCYIGVGIYFYMHSQYLFVFLTGLILVMHWVIHKLYVILGVSHCDIEFPNFHRKVIHRFMPRVVALYTYFDKLFIIFVIAPVIAVYVGLPEGAAVFLWGAVIAIALCFAKLILLWNYRRRGLYHLVHQPWGKPEFDFPHRS